MVCRQRELHGGEKSLRQQVDFDKRDALKLGNSVPLLTRGSTYSTRGLCRLTLCCFCCSYSLLR